MTYTMDQISNMDFGLKKDRYYFVYKGGGRKANYLKRIKGIYLGEGGIKNHYLIFKTKKGYIEIFLKIDILIGEYKISETNMKFALGGEHIV